MNDWKKTKLILAHGGEVFFDMEWDINYCWPGFPGMRGNGLDFAKDLKIKIKSENDYNDLFLLLNKQKVNFIFLIKKLHKAAQVLFTYPLPLLIPNIIYNM